MRQQGFSYDEILKSGVKVSQSTISRWCHDIALTETQKRRLLEKKHQTSLIKSLVARATESKARADKWAQEQVKKFKKLFDGEKLLPIIGAALYWAEGAKITGYKSFEFTNTDPKMIRIMMRFLREVMCVPENKLLVIVRIGKEGNLEKARCFWSKVTKLPFDNFRGPELLTLTENSKSLIKYPHGMCRIFIHDVDMARKVASLIEKFLKEFYKDEEDYLVPVAQLDQSGSVLRNRLEVRVLSGTINYEKVYSPFSGGKSSHI